MFTVAMELVWHIATYFMTTEGIKDPNAPFSPGDHIAHTSADAPNPGHGYKTKG